MRMPKITGHSSDNNEQSLADDRIQPKQFHQCRQKNEVRSQGEPIERTKATIFSNEISLRSEDKPLIHKIRAGDTDDVAQQ